MDGLIKRYDAVRDADLMLCEHRGVAYQKKMSAGRVSYDDDYLKKFDAYDEKIAHAVKAGRCEMLGRHLHSGAKVLDVGAGSGAFVRDAIAAGFETKGFEVIRSVANRLREENLYAESPAGFDAVTLWDVIEHMDDPDIFLRNVPKNSLVFTSLPIFDDLKRIRESKHYRPGEHLYYWTANGFADWMSLYGFRLLEQSQHENQAGREGIGSFVFRRDLPDYHDHIAAYRDMHSTSHYGSSAVELHLDIVAEVVREIKPRKILDYGCGRSDLAPHFWLDGERLIKRYDPAIPQFKTLPEGPFHIVFCMDVLEHVPMQGIHRVLSEIRTKSDVALFSISTKLARAKLPDGRNAHVTLLRRSEWMRWIAEIFNTVRELPSNWEHELIVIAGAENA